MKRKQVAALIAGAALGMGCVALGVVLARKEGREAARRFIDQYGSDFGTKGSQVAANIANSARQVGEQVAKSATEQYKAQLPKAKEAFNSAIAQAPQAVGTLTGALARNGQNGRRALTEGSMEPEAE
jgi:hypothetical protein